MIIYAHVVETDIASESGFNLNIVTNRADEAGVDMGLSLGAEEQIAMRFEIEGDQRARVFTYEQVLWWLSQNSFIATSNTLFYTTNEQFQLSQQ